jgi:hypothetical protein
MDQPLKIRKRCGVLLRHLDKPMCLRAVGRHADALCLAAVAVLADASA